MKAWIVSHKALLGTVVSVLAAVSGVLPVPYNEYLFGLAVVLAAVSGGPRPPAPKAS